MNDKFEEDTAIELQPTRTGYGLYDDEGNFIRELTKAEFIEMGEGND